MTVFGDEPIYRDIFGFYSNELDMEIELGSDLRAIDEITGETDLSRRAGERINLKIGGDGASSSPDSGEFFYRYQQRHHNVARLCVAGLFAGAGRLRQRPGL